MKRLPALENFRRRDMKPAAAKGEKEVSPTRLLADYLIAARAEELPTKVRHEGARTLLNWIGCAVGGSHHQTMDIAIQALMPFSGPQRPQCWGGQSASIFCTQLC
jgi:2-methylcitrate dehydratase PrpD